MASTCCISQPCSLNLDTTVHKNAAMTTEIVGKEVSQMGNNLLSKEDIRHMVECHKYGIVINEYKNGNISRESKVSELIGYCYYQQHEYHEAILHLKEALLYMPQDYYTNLFLGISFTLVNECVDATDQLFNCLKLEVTNEEEVLGLLLPLITEIEDVTERHKLFKKIKEFVIEKFGPTNPYLTKIYFYAKDDRNFTKDVLKNYKIYKLYSAKDLSDLGCAKYQGLGDPEKLRFVDINQEKSDIFVDTPHPYIAEIPNGRIISGSSLVFTEDKVLSDCLSHKKYGRFCDTREDPAVVARRDEALLINEFTPDTEMDEGFMLCGSASNAYGHWTAEFLPKLRFYEQHPRFSKIPIIVDEGMPDSHYDFLNVLTNNRIQILKSGQSLLIKNLFVSPTDTFFPTHLKPNHEIPQEHLSSFTSGALKYIDSKIRRHYGDPADNPTDSIFLSRNRCSWRKLINEEEIALRLKEFGFNTVHIEDYSFDEQVQIFQNAKFIIAPNGSALSNLIFSNPKQTKTIMMGQDELYNWGGWFGSFKELGYEIEYVSGKVAGENVIDAKHLDYFVSPSALISKVQQVFTKVTTDHD